MNRKHVNPLTIAGYQGKPLHLAQTRSSGSSGMMSALYDDDLFPMFDLRPVHWITHLTT